MGLPGFISNHCILRPWETDLGLVAHRGYRRVPHGSLCTSRGKNNKNCEAIPFPHACGTAFWPTGQVAHTNLSDMSTLRSYSGKVHTESVLIHTAKHLCSLGAFYFMLGKTWWPKGEWAIGAHMGTCVGG